MSNLLGALYILDGQKWHSFVSYGSVALNFIAAAILVLALFPPFLDTKRSKKTYGVSESFFMYYVMGGACMWINAALNILLHVNGGVTGDKISMIVLFGIFICVNSLSLYLNSYILKVKRKNMRDAESKGMSEQDYWEKYLRVGSAAQTDAAA